MPKPITKKLIPISMKVGESVSIYGFRFLLNTKTMKSHESSNLGGFLKRSRACKAKKSTSPHVSTVSF